MNPSDIDGDKPWKDEQLNDTNFRGRAIRILLKCLLHDSVGLFRVRLWAGDNDNPDLIQEFKCIESAVLPDCQVDGLPEANPYWDKRAQVNDAYCQYTIYRTPSYPYAEHQHWSMFSKEDPNCKTLHKDPQGSWIVGPVSSVAKTLVGFVSADMHRPSRDGTQVKEVRAEEGQRAFQRCAVDLITHFLQPLVRPITGK